tara:strand:+ start:1619 stop:1735 length:117 start_codon:yes stop_codon:yes gene_type:complete
MLNKIADKLAEDPDIRDWILEQNYKLPEPKDKKNDRRK